MHLFYTKRFHRSYQDAPLRIRRAFDKQAAFLVLNYRYPSLHSEKYDDDRWQARVTKDWRFYFRIEDNAYINSYLETHK